jgi:hypothetical protein
VAILTEPETQVKTENDPVWARAGVSADDILTGIRDADFWALAEDFGIEDDEAITSAVGGLRIDPVSEPEGQRAL